MFTAEVKVRVRYAETDQMGYVYYGNYATYYEVARVESLRSIGFNYRELEEEGIMLPVLENHSEFLLPAKYDDLLTIHVSIEDRPGVRINFRYEIFNEQETLLHRGLTKLAFVSIDSGKPCRPPEHLRELLAPYFE
jgi:acyl-CoA thioester hydrolase